MNRSLADAGPADTVQLLREQCERCGTCAACGSRETKLKRTRITCRVCGSQLTGSMSGGEQ